MQSTEVETHLYLVRHGETDYNRRGIVQGRGVDVPLNALGMKQAQALASFSVVFELDVIFSSTLLRARQTAQTVLDKHRNAPLIFLRDLEEMSWGDYEGLQVNDELRKEFDLLRTEWRSGNYDFALASGESALDVQRRGLSAISYILEQYAGSRIMIVAHGRFLRILLASILGEFGLENMEKIKHANTGVNYITHSTVGYKLKYLDNTDHLVSVN